MEKEQIKFFFFSAIYFFLNKKSTVVDVCLQRRCRGRVGLEGGTSIAAFTHVVPSRDRRGGIRGGRSTGRLGLGFDGRRSMDFDRRRRHGAPSDNRRTLSGTCFANRMDAEIDTSKKRIQIKN